MWRKNLRGFPASVSITKSLLVLIALAPSLSGLATCLNFNGTNSTVVTAPLDLSASNALTLEAWIKPRSLTRQMYSDVIRQAQTSFATSWSLSFEYYGTVLNFGLASSANPFDYWEFHVPIYPGDFVDGNWHHLAAVYDGATRRLYKDGVLLATAGSVGSTLFFSGGTFNIGSNPSDPTGYFDGFIDEVRVWAVARNAEQLGRQMNRSLFGSEPGLVAYWRFDEGTGTVAGDSTGHGHIGTLAGPLWDPTGAALQPATLLPAVLTDYASDLTTNSATLHGAANTAGENGAAWFEYGPDSSYGFRTSPVSISAGQDDVSLAATVPSLMADQIYHWRIVATNSHGISYGADKAFPAFAGKGAALSFDKVADCLRSPPINLSRSAGLTLEAWLKPYELTNSICFDIFRQQTPGSTPDFSLTFRANGRLLGFGLTGGGSYQELLVDVATAGIAPGTWHHLAAVYDGSGKRLFVDGLLLGSVTQTGSIAFSSGAKNTLGSSGTVPGFYDGLLDEVRIWGVARSPAEINQFKNQSLHGNEAGLLAYWRLDAASGTVAPDSSLHGYIGNMTGPNWVNENAPVAGFSGAPVAFTGPVRSQMTNAVVVTGDVYASGLSTAAFFEFGSSTNYGRRTQAESVSGGLEPLALTNFLAGFGPAQYGHYRLVAANNAGTNFGADRSFATAGDDAGFALNFDRGQQVFVPYYFLQDLTGSNAMSFEAWLKPADISSPNGATVLSQWQGMFIGFTNFGTTLRFGMSVNGGPGWPWGVYNELNVPCEPADYTDGNWHHLAAVYDGTNQLLYIDGKLLGFTNLSGGIAFYGTNSVTIGNGNYSSGPFVGQMDEIRLWRVGLTRDQIAQFMNMPLWSLREGLMAYWRCDEGSGTLLGDATGHGYTASSQWFALAWAAATAPLNGVSKLTGAASNVTSNSAVLNGSASPLGIETTAHFEYGLTLAYGERTIETAIGDGPGLSSVAALVTGLSPGTPYHFRLMLTNASGIREGGDQVFLTAGPSAGTALNLVGEGLYRYITVPSYPYLPATNSFTIEAWLLPSNLTTHTSSPIFVSGDLYSPNFLMGFRNYGASLIFGLTTSDGYQELSVTTLALGVSDGNWHHFAATYDGTSKRLFVDGAQVGAADQPGGFTLIPGQSSIFIGETFSAGGVDPQLLFGQMDELRIWRAARTPAQIRQFMHQSLLGTEPGLAAYYRFDQGGDGPLADCAQIDESLNTYIYPVYSPLWVASTAPLFGTLAPWLTSIVPAHAPVGSPVVLTGGNLTRVTAAALGVTLAPFVINSDASLTATVPLGARTGFITISGPYGDAMSPAPFVVDGPVVTFTTPQDATFIASLPLVRGTVADSIPGGVIVNVTLSIERASDSSFWTGTRWGVPTALAADLSGNNWSVTANLPPANELADGGYLLSVGALDTPGYTNRTVIGVTVSQGGPPPPAILLPNNHVLMRFPGMAGKTYRLQCSSDLVSWLDLANLIVDATGVLAYEEAEPALYRTRFFRILPAVASTGP